MIIDILKWYLILSVLGVIGFPAAFLFFRKLPGRGLVFSRALALLILSFFLWIGGTLGFLANNTGSLLLLSVVFAAVSAWLYVRNWKEIRGWCAKAGKYILSTEILFLAAFILIVLFRLGGPEVSGTEKPMEMMFINSILASESFPVRDAWLSGYSISYYYFGYIMASVLIRLSGVASAVGFNLMLATVFAMAAVSAHSIVNDLHALRSGNADAVPLFRLRALLAPFFILISGNLEGLFELLHSLRCFWNADGTSSFWTWLGLKELNEAPIREATWDISGRSGIWWWRASRVLGDRGLDGSVKEVIDEFPMFSFELGDLHPHVIAIPFVLLAVGIALNALISALSSRGERRFLIPALLSGGNTAWKSCDVVRRVFSADFWLTALCIGALLFINTWDFPFYFGLYCLCITGAYLRQHGWVKEGFTVFFETAIPLGIACIALYALFFLGFSSQAGGVIPSGVFTTRSIYLLIMFGLFLFPVLFWQVQMVTGFQKEAKTFGSWAAFWIFAGLMVFECVIVAVLIIVRGSNQGGILRLAADSFAGVQGMSDTAGALSGFFTNRLQTLPTLLILFAAAAFSMMAARQFAAKKEPSESDAPDGVNFFCNLLILIAAALVIFPEFFYLRDLFGTRMNTIFKFYYQAWILFGLSAAAICGELADKRTAAAKRAFYPLMVLLFAASCIYPAFCITGKLESMGYKTELTLDGSDYVKRSRADDWACAEWLKSAEPGVVLEKVGSSYGSDNLISTFTGLPAVLGPAGHESQWRGGYAEMGSRQDDVKKIYESHSWETTEALLNTYKIRYVFIGSAEKNAYNIQEKKFDRYLTLAYESGNSKVYQVY